MIYTEWDAISGLGFFLVSLCFRSLVASRNQNNADDNSQLNSDHMQNLESKVRELSAALERESELRKAERVSRIKLQKQARDVQVDRSIGDGFSYVPIGVVQSPFGKRCGTPRQPILCPAALGRICFNKTLIQSEHFQEIRDFSHIWVVWAFHGNTNADSSRRDLPSKVKPPRCAVRVGCLSTRSPHRPNAIGLSVVQVVGVGKDYIEISGLDMIDGTPVLDVKPYIPYDIIPFNEPVPMLGWAQKDRTVTELRCPSWIYEADIPFREVLFSPAAEVAMEAAFGTRQKQAGKKSFFATRNLTEVKCLIKQILQQDIRGRNTRGQEDDNAPNSVYNCTIDYLTVSFLTAIDSIIVCDVCYTEL